MHFTIDKTYTYLVAMATIRPWVRHNTIAGNGFGIVIYVSGNSNDYYQDIDTSLATVSPGANIVNQRWFDLYNQGFESENRGTITFDINGLQKQQSYTIKWGVDPTRVNKYVPYLISS